MRRAKSLRIGVHHADAVVWEPVCRTHLRTNVTIGGASEASSAGAAASASASDAVDGRHCDGRTDRRSAGEDGEVSGERERREGGRAGTSW
jgi:hypothetical protein